MVTDEERDYMYRAYVDDPRARVNLGIRRRLAPLLRDDRRKVELMNGLLLSLPGTPIIYYGDEIRMGDNIFLGDRDSVRTPMQWNDDRNAGFSRANPQRLFLPVIIDAPFHFSLPRTSKSSKAGRIRCCGGCERSSASGNNTRRSGGARSNFSRRTTRKSWPISANTKTRRFWSWRICRGMCNVPSWISRGSGAGCPSSFSGKRGSRRSANCRTF